MDGQIDLSIGLRTECQINPGAPCTYWVAHQLRYMEEREECPVTCCYACKEKNNCGYGCNQKNG